MSRRLSTSLVLAVLFAASLPAHGQVPANREVYFAIPSTDGGRVTELGSIQRITTEGRWGMVVRNAGDVTALALDGAGNLCFVRVLGIDSGMRNATLFKLAADGRITMRRTLLDIDPAEYFINNENVPITVDADGSVYFATPTLNGWENSQLGRIEKITASGYRSVVLYNTGDVTSLAFDGEGNLYCVCVEGLDSGMSSAKLFKLGTNGWITLVRTLLNIDPAEYLINNENVPITVDADGSVYFAIPTLVDADDYEVAQWGRIEKITASGYRSVVLYNTGDVTSLAFDGEGNLYYVCVEGLDSGMSSAKLFKLGTNGWITLVRTLLDIDPVKRFIQNEVIPLCFPRPAHAVFVGAHDYPTNHRGDVAAQEAFERFNQNVRNHGTSKLLTSDTSGIGQEQQLAQCLQDISARTRMGDTLLFFVNSHGGFDKTDDEWIANCPNPAWSWGCVLPCDEPPVFAQYDSANPACRVQTSGHEYLQLGRSDQYSGRVYDTELAALFNTTKWNYTNKLFVISSCYSGGVATSIRGLPRTAIVYDASEANFSYADNPDGKGLRGILGIKLRDALTRTAAGQFSADSNKDGVVSFGELASYLHSPYSGAGYGSFQGPWDEPPLPVPIEYAPDDWVSSDFGGILGEGVYPGVGIASAKAVEDGLPVSCFSAVTTGIFDNVFYIESLDRNCGIRAHKEGHGLSVGASVDLWGVVQTDSSGERYIEAEEIHANGDGHVHALGMRNDSLGGGPFGLQAGITNAFGLNNIGLLVTTFGRITPNDATSFYVSDGSSVSVKVLVPAGVTVPAEDTYVAVTGISSCYKIGNDLYRLVRVREQNDIAPLP